jgi:hypothetical protein
VTLTGDGLTSFLSKKFQSEWLSIIKVKSTKVEEKVENVDKKEFFDEMVSLHRLHCFINTNICLLAIDLV